MKKIFFSYRPGASHRWIVLSVALAAGAGNSWSAAADALAPEARAANVAGGELKLADREFVANALNACRQQAGLAAVGVMRAGSSDIRSLAQQLETDYRSLTDSLDAIWRRTGSAAEKTPGRGAEPERALAEKSGAAFDREFLRTVTQGSGRILAAFEQAASTAKDPGVRELAAKQLPVLRAHRTTLTELNKAYD